MKEYKIITDDAATCQKLLNQWKHEFHLDIISMESHPSDGGVRILLTREKHAERLQRQAQSIFEANKNWKSTHHLPSCVEGVPLQSSVIGKPVFIKAKDNPCKRCGSKMHTTEEKSCCNCRYFYAPNQKCAKGTYTTRDNVCSLWEGAVL